MRTMLAIIFITFATQASAEAVWSCEGNYLGEYDSEKKKITTYIPQNFKFSVVDKVIKFNSGGYFNASTAELDLYLPKTGTLMGGSRYDKITLRDGIFNYVRISFDEIFLISALCEKL